MVMPIPSASISWLREKVARLSCELLRAVWLWSGSEMTSVATRSTRSRALHHAGALHGVVQQHVRHLVREHGGKLRGIVGKRDQAARDVEVAARQREGVGDRGIQDRHLVVARRIVGRRDQAGDDLRHRPLDLRDPSRCRRIPRRRAGSRARRSPPRPRSARAAAQRPPPARRASAALRRRPASGSRRAARRRATPREFEA